jgi:hypothetical protein
MKKLTLSTLFVGMFSLNSAMATPFSISMVADNDFAIFSGTHTNINHLLYQNNVDWYHQIPALSTLSFNLTAGDNTFYVLGMGGGSEENISGKVNGVNMTTPSVNAFMSSDLHNSLTGYNLSSVAAGTYNAQLNDVQNAFSSLSWSHASSNFNTTQTVIRSSGFGSGFSFNSGTAHLFRFDAGAVLSMCPPLQFQNHQLWLFSA